MKPNSGSDGICFSIEGFSLGVGSRDLPFGVLLSMLNLNIVYGKITLSLDTMNSKRRLVDFIRWFLVGRTARVGM